MGVVLREMHMGLEIGFGRMVGVGLVFFLTGAWVTDVWAQSSARGKGVTYEDFGAVGDGKADDLPAICKAHEHANKNGLPVRSNPKATYHLGTQALTAYIETDTDWGTSKFIIDDSQGVESSRRSLFEVRSTLKPVPLEIRALKSGQTRLDTRLPVDCLVEVENENRKIFIRRGLNQNDGAVQQEVFILRKDGSIEGGIDWDYEQVTKVRALPIDAKRLILRGGVFTNIANQAKGGKGEKGTGYWGRNIRILRSNTEVVGVTHKVTGEGEHGQPYSGFLNVHGCAKVVLRDCRIDDRKTYKKIGNAGKPVAMGSYGYHASMVYDLRMIGCRMDDIHDGSRWGVTATNFIKNFLVEDCEISRVDVHMGISGAYIIRRSTIGHGGINAIGRGRLIVEDCTLHAGCLVRFREDYGSTWEGDVLVRNCRWATRSSKPTMFVVENDGTHDFGYPCFMPKVVRIEDLTVGDPKHGNALKALVFFSDPGLAKGKRPFPYRVTELLEVSGLKIPGNVKPQVCSNPEVAKAIRYVAK